MGQRAYSRHAGVTLKAVQKAILTGRITTLPGGKIDPTLADRQWATRTDLSKPRNRITGHPKGRLHEAVRGVNGHANGKANGFGKAAGVDMAYVQSQMALNAARQRSLDLKYDQDSGRLVDMEELSGALAEAVKKTRDRILSVPDRVDSRCAAAQDRLEINRLIRAELELALQELKGAIAGRQ